MLVDTHCHLTDAAFDVDREATLARAVTAGVGHVVIVASSIDDTIRARSLAAALGQSATAGVHPHEAAGWSPDAAARVSEALADDVVVAVGEAGLDYHYDHAPRAAQRQAFREQMAIAGNHRRPIVVHARDADDDMAAMLRDLGPHVPAVVLHSFSAGSAVFEAGLEIGAYFGWSGMVTFKTWRHDAFVTACPEDRLLLETDAPHLAPVPHRGRRNEPAWVHAVAVRVASIRGVGLDELETLTTANASRCFGRRVAEPQPTNV